MIYKIEINGEKGLELFLRVRDCLEAEFGDIGIKECRKWED